MSYSEKHKRNTSPVLRTTSEDRSKICQNKDNYIQYLEQQLQKTSKVVYQKYEERMRLVEETLQEHDEKFENFIKLIKLLQHFATTQEQENANIRNHVNISMEEIYSNELTKLKMQNGKIEQELFEIQQTYQKEQPILQEFELILNRKIDVIMDELKQSALKTDYQKLEQRLSKFELNVKSEQQQKINESERQLNSSLTHQQQLNDLKIVLDSVIQDQEHTKNTVQQLQNEIFFNKRKSQNQQIRKSITKESLYTENETLAIRPAKEMKENIKKLDNKRNKSKSSMSRSGSRNARLETIKKQKQENVKDLIKKHKQSSQKYI
ncbi:unnamed protein product (macronuclear) [Paramecium tetraurelia]|uniref:Uncharacterized protein n=1 Tax=Paramecium tetraurelia TaxID=5888 RepID=A0BCF8_PARTE|nr:uncharacterized protein GSPATT00004319001 [Paramecium tetraurelia]CAK56225.1 unnamed protein product [Paramecium tetraurelia]|eukprot:XP_001423623.1 hypothetical protein (macronuclear) [Paramecium tetraurelia strain d4-2]